MSAPTCPHCGHTTDWYGCDCGVREWLIEEGRRIIEEDKEFLDMLAAYDRGERTNTADVRHENAAHDSDVSPGRTKQGELAGGYLASPTMANNACHVEPSMALSRALNRGASIAHWAPWYRAGVR